MILLLGLLVAGPFVGKVAASGVPGEPRGAETEFTLQLLHFADIDGQPQAVDNVENFSRLVNKFEGEHPHNTLLVSSGDNYIPGPRFFAAEDEAMGSLLGIPGQGRADIDFSTDENTSPLTVEGGRVTDGIPARFAPSAVTVVGGEVIGLVGATTPQLSSITSTENLEITPDSDSVEELAAVIQPAVDRLTERGVDKIILLAHMQQISVERELAGELSDVDVIVAGGSNTILADETDALWPDDEAAHTYPVELSSETGEPTCII